MEKQGYFDLTEACELIEDKIGINRNESRKSIQMLGQLVAEKMSQGRPVVIEGLGSFELVYHQKRRWFSWLSPKREGETQAGYRIRFRADKIFKSATAEALPSDVKHIPVL
jgi:nucleoid DNA-binding protein